MDKEFFHLIENVSELLPETTEKLDGESLICECFCVSAQDIRSVCSEKVDLTILKDQFQLGQGCQSCLKRLDSWVNRIF